MNIKKLIGLTALACAFCAHAANEFYVSIDDPNASDTACEGRGTKALPYWSIQAAVSVAAEGDTVWVEPGVYTNGTATAPATSKAYNWAHQPNRVVITNSINLFATGSAAETLIVGKRSTASVSGAGGGAIRCVLVTETAPNAIVKGFTLASGATRLDEAKFDRGGGFYGVDGGYLVDCAITNCGAYVAAAQYGGTAVRCYYKGQMMYSWETAVAQSCNMWNCVVVHDYYKSNAAGQMTFYHVTNVNCSVLSPKGCANNYGVGCASYNLLSAGFGQSDSVASTVVSENCVYEKDGNGYLHWMNPLIDDFRLLSGANKAEGKGLAKWVVGDEAIIKLPAAIAKTDFTGNDLSGLTGEIAAGASQTVAEQSYGGVRCYSGVTVNGVKFTGYYGYLYATNWPCRWTIENANNYKTLYYTREVAYSPTGDKAVRLQLPPNLDGSFTVMPPKDPGLLYSLWQCTGQLMWVDDGNGSDETGTGTEDNPYKTIMKALASGTTGYPRINVKPGVYDEGGVVDSDGVENRIALPSGKSYSNILIFAPEGPEKTILFGATNETDNVRIFGSSITQDRSFLQGFTLTGGRTVAESGGAMHGAVGSGMFHLVDCIVSNNVASGNLQACNARTMLRTRYFDNRAGQYVVAGGIAYAFCAFAGNTCPNGVISSDNGPIVYNCSFAGNDTGTSSLLYPGGIYPNYCLFDANGGLFTSSTTGIAANYLWNFSSKSTYGATFTVADPCFADDTANDLRLYTVSPAVNAGTYFDSATKMKDYSVYALADVLGRPIGLNADSTVTMGAYNEGFVNGAKIASAFGGLAVEGAKIGSNVVEPGQTLTFSLSKGEGGTRNCTGVVVNEATTNYFADAVGGKVTLTVDAEHPAYIAAIYDTNWYVDAENGDDANDGFTAATAKKTLVGAMTNANVIAGDTVHALPGTYDEGRIVEPNTSTSIYSRVEIPAGVSLVSTGGKEVTVIKGAKAEEAGPEARDAGPFTTYGVGLRATRCVFMNKNTRLEGFTLTGGRCYVRWVNGSYGYRINGSGVLAMDKTARVVGCDITDCVGVNGAAAYSGTLVNCRVIGCYGAANGSDDQHVFYKGPTLHNVLAYGTVQGTTYSGPGNIYNSTIIGAQGLTTVNNGEGNVRCYNTLFYGRCAIGSATQNCRYYNCVIATNSAYSAWGTCASFDPESCSENCVFPAVKDVPVGKGYKPTGEDAAMLVNAGDNALVPAMDEDTKWDVVGVPRVTDYDVDIGAYEWDTRPEMKEILGGRIGSVGWISSNAVVTAGDKVMLDGDGATLEVTKANDSPLATYVTFADGGTLTALVNGVAAATTAKNGLFQMGEYKDGDKVTLVYEGEGSVTFGKLVSGRGIVIIFR